MKRWREIARRRRAAWRISAALLLGFVGIQFMPVARTNPPSRGEFAAPVEVAATLRRACYDCHSNQTRWPWYSGIAPLSWLIASHVNKGRRQLNFSEWAAYYARTRRRKLQWMGRALHEAAMPPSSYLLFHRDARLTAADRAALTRWIESALAAPDSSTSQAR